MDVINAKKSLTTTVIDNVVKLTQVKQQTMAV